MNLHEHRDDFEELIAIVADYTGVSEGYGAAKAASEAYKTDRQLLSSETQRV